MMTDVQRRNGCGCCLLIAILVLAIAGCVIVGHMRLTGDVAVVKDEPPEVVGKVITHMGTTSYSTNEMEIRK
jgi:hypothetical protein